MKSIHYILALTIIIATGCARHHNLSPFGWTSVDTEIDSAIYRLEYGWINRQSLDQLSSEVSHLDSIVKSRPYDAMLETRRLYWNGRLALKNGNQHVADSLFARGLEVNDSTSSPYETYRLRWTSEPDELPKDVDIYLYLKDQAEFFESAGDLMLSGARWMDLGMLINDLGNPQQGMKYLDHADSLLRLGGFDEMLRGNMINRSNVLFDAGRPKEAEATLRAILADSAFYSDPFALNIAYCNLFVHFNDTTALFKAYDGVRYDPEAEDEQAYYEGALAGVYVARHQLDSALYYKNLAMSKFPALSSRNQRIDVLSWAAITADATGDETDANRLLHNRLEETEMMQTEQRRNEVINQEFNDRLNSMERDRDRRHARLRYTTMLIISLLVVIFLAVWFIYYRRLQRSRLQQMAQQLKLEQTQRKVLAMKLSLDQKNTLIESIEENMADADNASRVKVESAIRTHQRLSQEQKDSFEQAFTELHPDFGSRLHETFPSLTESDRRLLSLIALGLSNRQIANTLNIRIESVKQSRWRIRGKMNLPSGASIEDAIAPLLK